MEKALNYESKTEITYPDWATVKKYLLNKESISQTARYGLTLIRPKHISKTTHLTGQSKIL